MSDLVLSSSASVKKSIDNQYDVFNGINVQLRVSSEVAEVLLKFETPQNIESILDKFKGIPQLNEILDALRRTLVIVPATPDDKCDMRMTWNCLAEGSDNDAAFVIDNETKTMEEFRIAGEEGVKSLGRLICLDPNWRVVNIGCGIGRIELPLAERVAHIHGFDVSDKMITRARNYLAGCSNVDLTRTDSELTGISDGTIDLVISFLVFQHCPKDVTWKYFEEAHRVLGGNGYFLFQILCYKSLDGFDASPRSPFARYYGSGKPHYSKDEVCQKLAESGFTTRMFREGKYQGEERRLSGTASSNWSSKLVLATKTK